MRFITRFPWEQVCTSLDWMCFFDHFNAYIQHNQDYSVYGYLPYTFVALHFQFAAVLGQKIKYPMAQTEVEHFQYRFVQTFTNCFYLE